jgi:branched-chain amino acid transport system ATP-binding protein
MAQQTSTADRAGLSSALSVDEVARQAQEMAEQAPDKARLKALCRGEPHLSIDALTAGYGKMEILHDFDLRVGSGQSLCLIGPNGAGKSTVLHSVFGFTNIFDGSIHVRGTDVTRMSPKDKLATAGIAYILQDNSVFPDLTVEENLLMGGYLLESRKEAKRQADRVFEKYPRLAERKNQRAGVLSGGERRLLEISRALVMDPSVLLVDEPSIGLEPRFIEMVFGILADLKETDEKTILLVEQNAKKGLEFADVGYVLVAGQLAMAGPGHELLDDDEVAKLFLGG